MVLIVMMMVMLCLAETLSNAVIGCVRHMRASRPRIIVRARQYRFN